MKWVKRVGLVCALAVQLVLLCLCAYLFAHVVGIYPWFPEEHIIAPMMLMASVFVQLVFAGIVRLIFHKEPLYRDFRSVFILQGGVMALCYITFAVSGSGLSFLFGFFSFLLYLFPFFELLIAVYFLWRVVRTVRGGFVKRKAEAGVR